MRDFVLIEPPQVQLDVFGTDVEAAPRKILAQFFCRGVNLRLKEGADAARSALPPHKAKDRGVLLSHVGRQAIDWPDGKARGIKRPVSPCRQVISADDVVINPMNGAFRLIVRHKSSVYKRACFNPSGTRLGKRCQAQL